MIWPKSGVHQANEGGLNIVNTGTIDTLNIGAARAEYPFVLVENLLIKSSHGHQTVAVGQQEYQDGAVHELAAFDVAARMLDQSRIARLVGSSGVGKTTLALQLAMSPMRRRRGYYLDLGDLGTPLPVVDTAYVLERLMELDDDGVLFVVDNAHLDARFERALLQQWRSSRAAELIVASRRDDSTLHDGPAIQLKVTVESLRAVIDRIARQSGVVVPTVPAAVETRWLSDFPDLVSFSLAVARRIRALAESQWNLLRDDALRQVELVYLDRRKRAELINLKRLAILARFELGLALKSLERRGIEHLVRDGLVHQVESYYVLGHPVVGSLLFERFDMTQATELEVLAPIVFSQPMVVTGYAASLAMAGEIDHARAVIGLIAPNGRLAVDFGRLNASDLIALLVNLVKLGGPTASDLDLQLEARADDVLARFHATPFALTPPVIHASRRYFPQLHSRLRAALDEPWRERGRVWAESVAPRTGYATAVGLRTTDAAFAAELEAAFLPALRTQLEAELGSGQVQPANELVGLERTASSGSVALVSLVEMFDAGGMGFARMVLGNGFQNFIAYLDVAARLAPQGTPLLQDSFVELASDDAVQLMREVGTSELVTFLHYVLNDPARRSTVFVERVTSLLGMVIGPDQWTDSVLMSLQASDVVRLRALSLNPDISAALGRLIAVARYDEPAYARERLTREGPAAAIALATMIEEWDAEAARAFRDALDEQSGGEGELVWVTRISRRKRRPIGARTRRNGEG